MNEIEHRNLLYALFKYLSILSFKYKHSLVSLTLNVFIKVLTTLLIVSYSLLEYKSL